MADLGYPAALALTLVVEVPVWTALAVRATGAAVSRALGVAVLVNLVSHPVLWFVLVPAADAVAGRTVVGLLAAEAVVVVGEAALARALLGRAFGLLLATSLAANAASLAVGLLLAG